MSDITCRWCGEVSVERGKRSAQLINADHETHCKKAPWFSEKPKDSSAWNPQPWKVRDEAAAKPKPELITYIGGPWGGQRRHWEGFLVDGTVLVTEPPLIHMGPTASDSAGRMCSKYMGHYQLGVEGECAIYQWVATLVPKKRLPKQRTFRQAWPELAERLENTDERNTDREDSD